MLLHDECALLFKIKCSSNGNKVFVPLDARSQKNRPIRFTNNRIFGECPTRCIISMTSMENVKIDTLLV